MPAPTPPTPSVSWRGFVDVSFPSVAVAEAYNIYRQQSTDSGVTWSSALQVAQILVTDPITAAAENEAAGSGWSLSSGTVVFRVPTYLNYNDLSALEGHYYQYTITTVIDLSTTPVESTPSTGALILTPAQVLPGPGLPPGLVRWKFTDLYQVGPSPYSYQFDINPNDGGSPEGQKNLLTSYSLGPSGQAIVQEGNYTLPVLAFSGVIRTQEHYEALEVWFMRRVELQLSDDLGRTFLGIFSKFSPKRVRRSTVQWYHTYDAEFTAMAYVQASGTRIYGRNVSIVPPTG